MNASHQATDVIVIGAGIVGAAIAHELSRAGHQVVVLERNVPNREGSGTTAGNLHIQAIHPSRPGQSVPADIGRFLPLQLAASDLWENIEEELGGSVELRREGGFMVAETAQQVDELRQKHQMEQQLGLETELVTGDEARQELPLLSDSVLAADWCPRDGYANPLLITPRYLAAAAQHGAYVLAAHPVTAIERVGDQYRVKTPHGSWTSPWVIDAAGPWMSQVAAMAGINLGLSPVAIQMHVTVRTDPIMRHLVQHVSEGFSVKQVKAGNFLIGGGWPAGSFNPTGRSITSTASMIGNLAQAIRLIPSLADLQLLRAWAGPLAATPDEMPVIGTPSTHPRFVVVGGTYAFTLAPLWAQVTRAIVEDREPALPVADLGPDRLITPDTIKETISWSN